MIKNPLEDKRRIQQVKDARDKGKGLKRGTLFNYKDARKARSSYSGNLALLKTLCNRGVPYSEACKLV